MMLKFVMAHAKTLLLLGVLAFNVLCACAKQTSTPVVFETPHEEREQGSNFGQTTCVSWTGRHIAVGANGFENFRGAMYIHELRASGMSGRRRDDWLQVRVDADDGQEAEEYSSELRPQSRGSGFGFSCAFASTLADERDDSEYAGVDAKETAAGNENAATKEKEEKETEEDLYLLVGAPGHDVQRGAVYVFRRERLGEWRQVAKLVGPNRRVGDTFGWAVAVDARCTTVAVGSRGHQVNNGEVVVFRCDAGCVGCNIAQLLTPPDYTDTPGPRGIRIRNNFGTSVALSARGDKLVVGCTGLEEESGVAYVYTRLNDNDDDDGDGGDVWNMSQRLRPPRPRKFSFFGYRVSMDARANVVAVGADGEDDYRGAVYIFEREGWLEGEAEPGEAGETGGEEYRVVGKLRAARQVDEDNFGASVSVSGNGSVLAIGAPGAAHGDMDDHGVLHVYERVQHKRQSKPELELERNWGWGWDSATSVWLPHPHSRERSLFAWAVAISGDGRRVVATAPEWRKGIGLAAVTDLIPDQKRTARWYFPFFKTKVDSEDSKKEEL